MGFPSINSGDLDPQIYCRYYRRRTTAPAALSRDVTI